MLKEHGHYFRTFAAPETVGQVSGFQMLSDIYITTG